MELRPRDLLVALCVTAALGVSSCGSGSGMDAGGAPGADLAPPADVSIAKDLFGTAPTGGSCDGVKCGPMEFCIRAFNGIPPAGGLARCQVVPDCNANPTCDCFAKSNDACSGWNPGGNCFIDPFGVVTCMAQ